MTTAISKFCAGLCFVGALALAPGCGDSGGKSECEDGQKLATVGETTDCFDECVDGACGAGFSCRSGLCIAEGGGTNNPPANNPPTNNPPTNNPPANNPPTNNPPTNNPPMNNPPNNNTPIDPAIVALCVQYADLLFGMCFDTCTLDAELSSAIDGAYDSTLNGDGTAQNPGCARQLAGNPQFVTQVEDFVADNDCDTLSSYRCGTIGLTEECGCAPPVNLGAACTDDAMCDGGDLDGVCISEMDNPELPGGMCVAVECPSSVDAPDGFLYNTEVCGTGVCQNILTDDGGSFGLCLPGCGGGATCRTGFGCSLANILALDDTGTAFEAVLLCQAACSANADCGDGSRCNPEGGCEIECDGTPGANGEPSLAELCVATGGTCTVDPNDSLEYCAF